MGKHILFVRVIGGKGCARMIRCAIFPSRGWDGYCLMSLFILYVSVRERNMVLPAPASLMREPTLPDMY
jgi:hypothetical protein